MLFYILFSMLFYVLFCMLFNMLSYMLFNMLFYMLATIKFATSTTTTITTTMVIMKMKITATTGPDDRDDWAMDKAFKKLLSSIGIIPMGTGGGDGQLISGPNYIPVLVDGVVFGGMKSSRGADIVAQLRLLKVTGGADSSTRLDPTTELAYIPYSSLGGAYPGLYIFTQPGRMIRPVMHLKTRKTEWIGPMEQVFMDIACLAEDKRSETTHMELGPGIMLSQVASMTPFRFLFTPLSSSLSFNSLPLLIYIFILYVVFATLLLFFPVPSLMATPLLPF